MSELNTDQFAAIIRERDTLRARTNAQAETIETLKRQYADLADDHSRAVANYEQRLHNAFTERDQADTAASEVKTILLEAAQQITQGLRAIKGNQTAEQRKAEPPVNTTVAPLHTPSNHPALIRAIDGGDRANVPQRS